MVRTRSSTLLLLQLLKVCGWWLWMASLTYAGEPEFSSRIFKLDTLCHMEERLRLACAQEKSNMRSLFDCLRECNQENICVGASLDETSQTCVLHQVCSSSVECSPGDTRHHYWESYCVHGHWDSATRSCQCLYKTFGDRCDQYIKDCPAGLNEDPVLIDLQEEGSPTEPMIVICDDRFIIVGRNSGKAVFNRTYQEYVRGFWEDAFNFWTGLKHLNRFSDTRYQKFSIIVNLDDGSLGYWRIYRDFTVKGEDEDFKFSGVHFASGTQGAVPPGYLGDCLGPVQGTAFSTWDNDKDGAAEENCASIAGSGWWYSGCDNPCNLLGWGLDDWDGTSPRQRLSAIGLDIEFLAARVYDVKLLLERQ